MVHRHTSTLPSRRSARPAWPLAGLLLTALSLAGFTAAQAADRTVHPAADAAAGSTTPASIGASNATAPPSAPSSPALSPAELTQVEAWMRLVLPKELDRSLGDAAGPGGLELPELATAWQTARRKALTGLLLSQKPAAAAPTTPAHARPALAAPALAAMKTQLGRGEVGMLAAHLAQEEAALLAQAGKLPAAEALRQRLEVAELARQQGALLLPTDGQAALAAFRRALEHDGGDAWSAIAAGNLLALAADQDAAILLYRRALETLGRLYTAAGGTPTGAVAAAALPLLHARAITEFRLGEMQAARDLRDEAFASHQRGLAHAERLLAAEPEGAERQFDVLTLGDRVAEHYTARNQWAPALALLQRNLALSQSLVAADPEGEATWRFYAMDKLEHIGDLELALNQPEEALPHYRAGLQIGEALVARDIQNDDWLSGLLGLILKVGSTEGMDQSAEERRQLLLRGLELMARVRSGSVWDNSEEWGDRLRAPLRELPLPEN